VNDASARALNALNQIFYTDSAALFDETRRAAWPGWLEILPLLQSRVGPRRAVARVLDVGCGNARFARFLESELGAPFLYCGIDASAPLLASAARSITELAGARLLRADLVLESAANLLPEETFDCVAAFGLLHHIPGESRRRALLEALAARVARGGFLAVAFWDFGHEPRLAAKDMSAAVPPEVAGALEPGDHLLRWGPEGSGRVRYCHHADDAEIDRLLDEIGLEPGLAFDADGRSGRSNRYRVQFRR
jgi:tRNA (uracil-5-)-methyltransferase TRM9